jgi:hypothetical protein
MMDAERRVTTTTSYRYLGLQISSDMTIAECMETSLRKRAFGMRTLAQRVLLFNRDVRERAPYTVKLLLLKTIIYAAFSFPILAVIFKRSSPAFHALERVLGEATRCVFNMPRSFPKPLTEFTSGILPLWPAVAIPPLAVLVLVLGWLGQRGAEPFPAVPAGFGSPSQVAMLLLGRYLLAFELISIVLLVAIIGALALGQGERKMPWS